MKKFAITLAIVASAVSSFANCGSCGSCAPQCAPRCAPQCARPCNSCCPAHYYPGQTFCTQGGGVGLNLFGGCGSCNPCGGGYR